MKKIASLIGDEGSANCTIGETMVTCTDAGALGDVGSYFYVIRVFNGAGLMMRVFSDLPAKFRRNVSRSHGRRV
jgi:hypothetical protein